MGKNKKRTMTKCLRCNKVGHVLEECLEILCGSCQKLGHSTKDCPGRLCVTCGEQGHAPADCPHQTRSATRPQSRRESPDYPERQCRHCQQTGHLPSNCPQVVCHKCGEQGHMQNVCSQLVPSSSKQPLANRQNLLIQSSKQSRPTLHNTPTQSSNAQNVHVRCTAATSSDSGSYDTEGHRLWQQNQAPAAQVTFPADFEPAILNIPVGYDFASTRRGAENIEAKRRKALFDARFRWIAKSTNSHLDLVGRTVRIWANGEDTKLAVKHLKDWISECNEDLSSWENRADRGKKNFVKLKSSGQRGWGTWLSDINGAKEEKQQDRQIWCKDIDDHTEYLYSMTVEWPSENDYQPPGFLGPNLEDLNGIKMKYKTHIMFLPDITTSNDLSEKSYPGFILAGNNEQKMLTVVDRLQHVPLAYLAKKMSSYTHLLVKPFPCQNLKSMVQLVEYYDPRYLEETPRPEKSLGKYSFFMNGTPLTYESIKDHVGSRLCSLNQSRGGVHMGHPSASRINSLYLERWLTYPLTLMQYYKGELVMLVSIGTFVASRVSRRHVGGSYDLETFESILEEMNSEDGYMEVHVSEELGNPTLECRMLDRFSKCSRVLSPIEKYSAEFLVPAPKGTSPTDSVLKLEINFQPGSSTHISRWSRHDKQTSLVDVHIIDVHSSEFSYNIALQKHFPLNEKGEERYINQNYQYLNFAHVISILPEPADHLRNGQCFVVYPNTHGLPSIACHYFTQKHTRVFPIRNSPYQIRLTHFQTFDIIFDQENQSNRLAAREPRWNVKVDNPNWENAFAQNRDLEPGQKADWLPEEWYFFPPNVSKNLKEVEGTVYAKGSGMMELMRILGFVEDVITGKFEQDEEEAGKFRTYDNAAVKEAQAAEKTTPSKTGKGKKKKQ